MRTLENKVIDVFKELVKAAYLSEVKPHDRYRLAYEFGILDSIKAMTGVHVDLYFKRVDNNIVRFTAIAADNLETVANGYCHLVDEGYGKFVDVVDIDKFKL